MTALNQNSDEEKELIKLQIEVQKAILRKEKQKEKLISILKKYLIKLIGIGFVYLIWYFVFKEFILSELPMIYRDIHGEWKLLSKELFRYSSEINISDLPSPYLVGYYVLPLLTLLFVVGLGETIKDIFRILLLVVKAIQRISSKWYYIYKLRTDRGFVLEAITKDRYAFTEYAHKKFNNDREIVLASLKQNLYTLEYASPILKNDKAVVLAALEVSDEFGPIRSPFEFASESLQNDKEFVMIAVKLQPNALEFVSEELKNDPEVVSKALAATYPSFWSMGRPALKFASKKLKNDKEIVLAALQNSMGYWGKGECSLKYASKVLRNDREVVLAAVKTDGKALKYASKELQNDKEIVSQAILSNFYSIKFASKNIQVDKLYIRTLIDEIKSQLENLSNESENEYFRPPLEVAHESIKYLESEEWIQ